MKMLLFLLVSFSFLIPLTSRSKECVGGDCPNPDTADIGGIIGLPIQINFDGSTQFSFGATNTTVPQREVNPLVTWYIEPLVMIHIDSDKVLINLDRHSLNKSITLEGANPQTGYLVLQKSRIEIGAGAGTFFDPVSSLSFGFGIIPSAGSILYSERLAPNLEEAKHLKKMKFPKDAQSLDSWSDNDLLVYTRRGGISFYVDGGMYGASVGAGYNAAGLWRVMLKKVSSGKILATVSKMKLDSFSVFAGVHIVSLDVTLFGATDKSFAYEFDLESKSGQQGFDEFLSGNFKFTKRMAQEGVIEGVTPLTESQARSRGRVFGLDVGIPFLGSLDFQKGMIQSFSETLSLKNGQKSENTMAVYSRSVETSGVITKKMRDISLFAANHQEIKGSKKESSFNTANFKWLFSQEKTSIKDVQSRLMEIKRITGLWHVLEFNFPEEKKLAYSQFEFDAMISSKGSQKLMASELDNAASLVAEDRIEEFFNQENVPEKVCGLFKKIETCKKHMLKTTSVALKKMAQKLEQMKNWYQEKDWKNYTKTFAGLGEEAITNQFTFGAFMEMIGKENIKMEFKVSGEKIKTLHLANLEKDSAFQ